MYYVYILHSDCDQGLYIGFTSDLTARVAAHNRGDSKSTASRCPLRLIYYEAYTMEQDALGRERYLKSGAGRRHIDKQLRCYFEQYPHRKTT
ncbi:MULTISPECIES: GIY-YIG nuclease family protein [unclassified Lentimonas]|uniref:GIY-YIG nuclease family protein n=1 Tax=unclassified Lentimonas TaxID=2630993 RepID=UPI0013256DCE